MVKLTLQPMEYMSIHTNPSDLKQIIPNDAVLEMTQTQPNTTFLKQFYNSIWVGKQDLHRY